MATDKPILFVSHEATRTGAPMVLLHILRWLRDHTTQDFGILLGRGGAMENDFAKVGQIYTPEDLRHKPDLLRQFSLIYSNTTCNGLLLEGVPYGDLPIITHAHELDFGIDCGGAKNMAAVIKQTSHFIVCAKILGERLHQRFRIPREQISVHYECIPYDLVRAKVGAVPPSVLREKYDIPEEAFAFAACGTVDVRKAPDLFVQLAACLRHDGSRARPLRFLWIGKVNDPTLHKVLQYDIRRLGLQKEVTFVGELESPHSLLSLADAFCLTSREDPFPLVMLEAAALGKPVLCFEGAGGGGEFCAEGGGLAVPFLDVEAMAQKCRELMRNEGRRSELGHRAAELVRTRFDVEVIVPQLWRELEAFVRQPPPLSTHRVCQSDVVDIFSEWLLDEAPDQASVRAQLALKSTLDEVRANLAAGRREAVAPMVIHELEALVKTEQPETLLDSLTMLGEALLPPGTDRASLPSQGEFDEESYLAFHPDVAAKVPSDYFVSGWEHFQKYGFGEGRRWLRKEVAAVQKAAACLQAGDPAQAQLLLDDALAVKLEDIIAAPFDHPDEDHRAQPSAFALPGNNGEGSGLVEQTAKEPHVAMRLDPAPAGSDHGLESLGVRALEPVNGDAERKALLTLLQEVPKEMVPPMSEFIKFASHSFKDGRIEAAIGSEQHHRTFEAFERLGLHIYPLHYYSPLPDTTLLHQNEPRWQKAYNLMDIVFNRPWEEELARQFALVREETKDLPCSAELQQQGWRPGYNDTDAMILYAMIRTTKPRRIIEVGSGISTVFSARAALRNREDGVPTSVQCIEPFPSQALRSLPGVEKLMVQEVQNVAPSHFHSLASGDMLIIDSSHIVRIDGDVNYLYAEVLPFLNEGVLVQLHDIPFPHLCYAGKPVVYEWLMFWQEAYLLKAFLSHNRAFEVVFSSSQMWHQQRDLLQQAFPDRSVSACPMSLWMHRHS